MSIAALAKAELDFKTGEVQLCTAQIIRILVAGHLNLLQAKASDLGSRLRYPEKSSHCNYT